MNASAFVQTTPARSPLAAPQPVPRCSGRNARSEAANVRSRATQSTVVGSARATAPITRRPASRRPAPGPPSRVSINAPAKDRRIIASTVEIAAPRQEVWDLLTDYNRLADHIPNLALSRKTYRADGIRLEQCGQQSILGFKFTASVVLDMEEMKGKGESERSWKIGFTKHKSRDFNTFQGEWVVEKLDEAYTRLSYKVDIVPRGLIPVQAVEWRVREDVPANLSAVQSKCQRRFRMARPSP